MSNVNNQFKELINEAVHNHFHDDTEIEMILKDWLCGVCEQVDEYESKAKAFDAIYKEFREVEHDDISFGFFMHNFMNKYESGDSE